MKTIAVIQARMNSTRLPGKVLEFIGDIPCIEHVVRRVQRALPLTVVTIPEDDEVLKSWCLRQEVPFTTGPENDLLLRYLFAAREYDADVIVRVTADCPFIDPVIVRKVADMGQTQPCVSTYNVIHGLDCESYSRDYLEGAHKHVTDPVIREGMDLARYGVKVCPSYAVWRPDYRWTLDTPDDLKFFRAVAERIDTTPPKPSIEDLTELLSREQRICLSNT